MNLKLLILSMALADMSNAQTTIQNWLWAKSVGGSDDVSASCIKSDNAGNIYLTGTFEGTSVAFGGITLTNKGNANYSDVFIAKYNKFGNVQWAKSAGGIYNDWGYSIAIDTNNNSVYLSGVFGESITFGNTTLTNAAGFGGVFVVKYDNAGNVIWSKGATGGESSSIHMDNNNNLYLTGSFQNTSLSLDGITLTNKSTNFTSDIFIVKYNSSGIVQWAKSAGGSSSDYSNSVCTDIKGNVFLTGSFNSSAINFNGSTLTNADSSGNTSDVFLVKYDSNGNEITGERAGGNSSDEGIAVTSDSVGNIYLTGYFVGASISFDSINLNGYGGSSTFITKLDSSGNFLWAKSANGGSYGQSIDLDNDNNVYITGSFRGSSVTFESITLTNANSSGSVTDIFLTKYDNSGTILWAKKAGGSLDDYSTGVNIDAFNNVFISGDFGSSTMSFGNYVLSNANTNHADLFISKLCETLIPTISANGQTTFCEGDSVILTSSSGNSFLWSNGAAMQTITVSTSGNYTVTVTNANGCPATSIPIKITVHPSPSVTIYPAGNIIFCEGDSVVMSSSYSSSYLWNTGASTQSIAVSAAGDYSVIVTDLNGCSATSAKTTVAVNPTFTDTATLSICSGDSILLQGSYQTTAGIYYDTLNSLSGCDSIIMTTLTLNPTNSQSDSASLCPGDSIFLQGSYQTGAGIYYDTLSSVSGCDSIVATTVQMYQSPAVPIITANGAILTSGSTSGNQWFGDGLIMIGETAQTFTAGTNGTYTVAVTDSNGCTAVSAPYNYTGSAIGEINGDTPFSLTPNPSNGKFMLRFDENFKMKNAIFTVQNSAGETVNKSNVIYPQMEMDLSGFPEGIYFIRIKAGEKTYSKKICITK